MRRTYISPEYKYLTRPGTFNMVETTSFFGSKMLDIEDSITIDNSNLVYYETDNKEQLNFNLEKNNLPIVYNTVSDKQNNHVISLDQAQSQNQLNTNTRWNIDIDLKLILINYLFAILKKERTFEGVKNESTIYNSVDDAIKQYISSNILNRYDLSGFDFYVEYVELSTQGRLRFGNNFREINTISNITTKIQSTLNFDKSRLIINFNQELPSTTHVFDYYFTLRYNKI